MQNAVVHSEARILGVRFYHIKIDLIHAVCFIRDTMDLSIYLSLKFYIMFSQNFPHGEYKLSLISCP